MKVALVHDYLNTYGGGERVLDAFHDIFPDAPIYTLLYEQSNLPGYYKQFGIKTTFIDKLPFKSRLFKFYVPLMPIAIETLNLNQYDLVISISAGFAKGIITTTDTCHISYTLTVPRFLWGYETSTQIHHRKNIVLPFINNKLRIWDKVASDRVDYFISNSKTTRLRTLKSYGRDSRVIYSCVDDQKYELSSVKREDYYLIVSRFDEYKRVDLAINTCVKNGLKLKIIGKGPERKFLETLSQGKVEFLGSLSDEEVIRHYRTAKAVIFPGADDLGLVPIEAQMCGTPVIAFKKDGAIETVTEDISGVYFYEQTEKELLNAIKKLDMLNLNPIDIRKSVNKFSKEYFSAEVKDFIARSYLEYKKKYVDSR